jgi:flagellar basal-body rod modification protein FlgD
MLSVTNKSGPYVAPQVDTNPAFEEAKKARDGVKENFNFDKVIGESNASIAAQLEADKSALGEGGELKIGESKNDKEFREMLERVSGRKQDKLKNKLDKDDYLNLMVTQLKYQDPTKPMENHEMATQLAQFNTVEQLINVNKSLTDMSNQTAQANVDKLTPYLGKLIEVNGSKLKVGTDQKVSKGSIELASPAGSVSVQIKDDTGTTVRTIGLGEKDAGRHTIEWDGKTDGGMSAKPGNYTFDVQASTLDGKELKAKTSFITKVDAITDLSSGGKLETGSGAVEAKDILAIRPDTPPAEVRTRPEPAARPERKENRDAANKQESAAKQDSQLKQDAQTKQGAQVKQDAQMKPESNAKNQPDVKADNKADAPAAENKNVKSESKKAV